MTNELIVAVFDDAATAEHACRDIHDYALKRDGFRIESGVLVQRDSAGKLSVLEQQTRSFWGTAVGALSGALLGSLGGPLGALAGLTIGAGGALAGRAMETIADQEWVDSVSATLAAGRVALILEAHEPSPFQVDNIVKGYGGTLMRRPLPG